MHLTNSGTTRQEKFASLSIAAVQWVAALPLVRKDGRTMLKPRSPAKGSRNKEILAKSHMALWIGN